MLAECLRSPPLGPLRETIIIIIIIIIIILWVA